jgi:hypothetical protein
VKNAIVVDNWLKFKVVSDDEKDKTNVILLMALRELMDDVILEQVVQTFAMPEEKTKMIKEHQMTIEVVRKILADEG